MRSATLLAVLATALVLAAPAYAQEPTVCSGTGDTTTGCTPGDQSTAADEPVGDGDVISDPAGEVDGDGGDDVTDEDFGGPQRGELHVLGAAVASGSRRGATRPVAARRAASPTRVTRPPVARIARAGRVHKLPFTGVNGAYVALAGAVLLAAGLGLRRATTS